MSSNHQTYARYTVEAAPLKDGTGKEIRSLHNLVTQHLRALKLISHEPSGSFTYMHIMSLLERKLDKLNPHVRMAAS